MNKQESDILKILFKKKYTNQRILSEDSGHSLGIVNRTLKKLNKDGYIDDNIYLTNKAYNELKEKRPKRAIILAAGYGMRMVPINTETPKGLIEVNSEPLIERIINQLHEVGIKEIHIVVGFMKERYEYLIDEFNVNLIYNPEYMLKNNLHSIKLVTDYLGDCYIVPCDIWCEENPFNKIEMYSWYMVGDATEIESSVRVNRKMELVTIPERTKGNTMIGICYLTKSDSVIIAKKINKLVKNKKYDEVFWEEALYENNRMIPLANVVDSSKYVEINTYEQLRELDGNSNHLKTDTINIIAEVLNSKKEYINDITVFKKGMTNRTFIFRCKDQKYIMRIPGEGTDQLINRIQEASVYNLISGLNISDEIYYMNPNNGYKITEFLENARVCNPNDIEDVKKCISKLRDFHNLNLKVNHEFDIFYEIEHYERLWNGVPSIFKDYQKTKDQVLSLKKYIDPFIERKVLTHIDAVPDNFLFVNKDGKEEVRIIDWEYAGMQDPHIDIAMFCIYSFYDRCKVDNLIDLYFETGCSKEIRIKIYCYIAVCGLLWSNWCEYKRNLGVEFGEYSLKQYRYAKEYYKIVMEEISNASR